MLPARVTAGVDGSPSALDAVRWAAEEARTRGAALRLVHAELPLCSDAPDVDGRVRHELHQAAWRFLHEAADAARDTAPGVRLDVHVEVADPAPLLVAESAKACLVVLGSRGLGGFGALLLGSTAIAVTAHAACPVVVVRGAKPTRPGPVVCGVSGSPHSIPVLARAYEHAAAHGLGLVVVNAWHLPFGTTALAEAMGIDLAAQDALHGGRLAELVAPWRTRYRDVPVEPVIVRGTAAAALLERARDAALVVVGSRGRSTATGLLLSSTSHVLLHHAPCPVLVVHPRPQDT